MSHVSQGEGCHGAVYDACHIWGGVMSHIEMSHV